jgi:hypothetical protein
VADPESKPEGAGFLSEPEILETRLRSFMDEVLQAGLLAGPARRALG